MKKLLLFTSIILFLCIDNLNSENQVLIKKIGFVNSDTLTDTLIVWKVNANVFLPKTLVLSDSLADSVIYYKRINFFYNNLDSTFRDASVTFRKYNNDEKPDILFGFVRDFIVADSTNDTTITIKTLYYIPGQDFQGNDTLNILQSDSIQYYPYKSAIMSIGKGIYTTGVIDYYGYNLLGFDFPMLDSLIEDTNLKQIINSSKNQEVTKDIKIKIYPNPANDKIIISIKENSQNLVKIELSDLLGNSIICKLFEINNLFNYQMDVSSLTSQIYYLRTYFPNTGHSEIYPILIIH